MNTSDRISSIIHVLTSIHRMNRAYNASVHFYVVDTCEKATKKHFLNETSSMVLTLCQDAEDDGVCHAQ